MGDRSSETLDDPQQQERAGRIFLHRTSFYPKSSGNVSNGNGESHLIYDALLGMVESVDREFHLYEQYMEIARLRAKRESIYWGLVVEKGEFPSPEAWHELDKELVLPQPGGPDTWLASEQRFNEENGLWWPLEDWRLTDEYSEPREPDSPFWALGDSISPNAACVYSGEDFFFVPHVYLGLCIDTTTLGTFVDGTLDGLLDMPTPCASWDEASNRYKLSEPEYVLPDGGVSTDYQLDVATSTTAHWLVIYPDPNTNKLVPMIYALGDSPGAELTPLSPDLIADFGDPGRWKYFGDDAPTLLQRLKDLTGYRTDDFMAYKSWRETAARFHWNPILRKHPNSIEDIRYRKRLLYWRRHDQLEFSVNEEN